MSVDLYLRLKRDLRCALANRQREVVATLRTAVAAIDNARAVENHDPVSHVGMVADVPRRELDDRAMRRVIEAEVAERHQAMAELAEWNRPDDVARLQVEVDLLVSYLDSVE